MKAKAITKMKTKKNGGALFVARQKSQRKQKAKKKNTTNSGCHLAVAKKAKPKLQHQVKRQPKRRSAKMITKKKRTKREIFRFMLKLENINNSNVFCFR